MRVTFVFFFGLFLGSVLLTGSASSQQSTVGAAPGASGSRQVRRILQPPQSAMAHGIAARSTGQTMAAHTDPPLPQVPAFAVTGLDGKPTSVSTLHPVGHWLLLYRSEHCAGCDKVMAALAKTESPLFKQGGPLVIVVKGGANAAPGMLDHLKGTYPTLSNAAWVEDTRGEALTALKPHGEPVLYAVSGNDIAWSIHGTLNNPAMLENQAGTWLASTSKPHTPSNGSTATKTAVVSTSVTGVAKGSH